jgi:1,4-dihydroxy-2-naphthoyl-CoA hydrolase
MNMQLENAMPFVFRCGIAIESATRDEVRGKLEWREELCTTNGVLHGGAVMTLADTLGAICAFLNLPEDATTATLESKTNFFRPVTRGARHGIATPLHVGRSTIVVQTELRDDAGKRVAFVVQTQAVIAAK